MQESIQLVIDSAPYLLKGAVFTLQLSIGGMFFGLILGFILMSGASSSEMAFEADIFSVRRIKVAPALCFLGFVSMIYAVLHKPAKPKK